VNRRRRTSFLVDGRFGNIPAWLLPLTFAVSEMRAAGVFGLDCAASR
jgi:hypothetical protein